MDKEGRSDLEDVLAATHQLLEDPRYTISRDQVMRWARSEDLEALGALHFVLFDPEDSRRIEPNLTLAEYMEAEFPYLERCFREDPQSQWANSRWSAGYLLTNWIKDVWADERFRPQVDDFRDWLAKMYKSADDPDLRLCLVQATLEHLFEDDGLAERFASWREDPELRIAYDEAKLWKEGLDELGIKPVDPRLEG
jgi:hypothetical protein